MTDFDCIELRGISEWARHGVYDFERDQAHPFRADLHLFFATETAAGSDLVEDTVHYGQLELAVRRVLGGEPVKLLEHLAEQIAIAALEVAGAGAVAIRVRVHKPEAPLAGQVENTSVSIWRGEILEGDDSQAQAFMNAAAAILARDEVIDAHGGNGRAPYTAILALGSNLGERAGILQRVIEALGRCSQISEVEASDIIETKPVLAPGQESQPNYLNAVVRCKTDFTPLELLRFTQGVEAAFGRERRARWEARTVDIDLISLFDATGVEVHSQLPELTLPHPRAAQRAFVLVPWAQLQREAQLAGQSVAALAEAAADREGIIAAYPGAIEPAEPVAAATAPAPRPRRRSIMRRARTEPVAGSESEPQPQTGVTPRLRRRAVTARPTTTGFIPVVKHPLRDDSEHRRSGGKTGE